MRKVSICTLGADNAQGASYYLEQKLRAYDSEASSANYGGEAEFADAVAECARNGGVVFAAASLPAFLKAKVRIIKLFSSRIVRNSAINSAMGEDSSADKDIHAAVPEKSKVFTSADGKFSAFAKELNGALVVFMPLEEGITAHLFETGLGGFLANVMGSAEKPSIEKV